MGGSLFIKDPSVNALADEVRVALKVSSKTEAVRLALLLQLSEAQKIEPLSVRLGRLQDRVAAQKSTGLPADKAFFDDLCGDL